MSIGVAVPHVGFVLRISRCSGRVGHDPDNSSTLMDDDIGRPAELAVNLVTACDLDGRFL
ncbi:hypothetical protein [Nakamurella sp.]|uniref:hypothetical protein n=1 Tax=Nakamurella sp. TaxID=1869182 RepID=UPI0037851A09